MMMVCYLFVPIGIILWCKISAHVVFAMWTSWKCWAASPSVSTNKIQISISTFLRFMTLRYSSISLKKNHGTSPQFTNRLTPYVLVTLGVEVAKLFLNPWNLGIPWHSVRFWAVGFRAFSPWSMNRFPSSFSSSHDILMYWEANSGWVRNLCRRQPQTVGF